MAPSFTPSFDQNLSSSDGPSIDFATLYLGAVYNGTYEPNDFALFSEKFNYDIPDISDIGKNYIGSEYLNETIIPNIYNRALEISDANELPCSINSTAQSLNCTEYTNIYGSATNLLNDLFYIWPLVPDPIEFPSDITTGVIADMINALFNLQNAFT